MKLRAGSSNEEQLRDGESMGLSFSTSIAIAIALLLPFLSRYLICGDIGFFYYLKKIIFPTLLRDILKNIKTIDVSCLESGILGVKEKNLVSKPRVLVLEFKEFFQIKSFR